MKTILKNWRTTLIGSGVLTGAITLYVQHPDQWQSALTMGLIGLIGLFAKDAHNDITTKSN